MVTWVLFAVNVVAIESQSNAAPTQIDNAGESQNSEESEFDSLDPVYLTMLAKRSQIKSTGRHRRFTS